MVYQDQNRVISVVGRGEIGEKIHGSMGKEVSVWCGGNRHKCGACGMSINLEALTFKTACNIVADKGSKAGPIVVLRNGKKRFKNAGVTSRKCIVFLFKDLSAKIKVGGNILSSFKVQECRIVFDSVG